MPGGWAECQRGEGIGQRDTRLLVRVFVEHFPNGAQDRNDRCDRRGQFEQLRNVRIANFHDPIDDFGGQGRILRNDVAFSAIAALRAGQRVFDAHRPGRFQFLGVGLPAPTVALIMTCDRSACGANGQPVGPFLDELFDLAADAVEWVSGNVVGICISVRTKREHILRWDMNRHVVEGSFHDPAGPASFVSLGHLFKPVRDWRCGK